MSKESWFHERLAEELWQLQQRIRCMHEYELQVATGTNCQQSAQTQLSQDIGFASQGEEWNGLVQSDSSLAGVVLSMKHDGANTESKKDHRPGDNMDPQDLQLIHPVLAETNRLEIMIGRGVVPRSEIVSSSLVSRKCEEDNLSVGKGNALEFAARRRSTVHLEPKPCEEETAEESRSECSDTRPGTNIGNKNDSLESTCHAFSLTHPLRGGLSATPRDFLPSSKVDSLGSQNRSRALSLIMMEADANGNYKDFRSHCFTNFWAWYQEVSPGEGRRAIMDLVMGIIILLNIVLIGVSLDNEDWDGWKIVEVVFNTLFALDILIKLWLFGWRDLLCGKMWAWNTFDIVVTAVCILDLLVDVGAVSFARVARLGRTLRLVRLIRRSSVKPLVMLLRGAACGAKCLFWCFAALALPIFLVGILLKRFLHDWEEDGLFSSVPAAMFTTMRCMFGECEDSQGRPVMLLLATSRGWHYAFSYSVFMLVAIFGVFNLITAIFIEDTMQVAKSDTYLQRTLRRLSDEKFAKNLRKLVFMFWKAAKHNARNSALRVSYTLASMDEFHKFQVAEAMDLQISQQFYDEMVLIPCVRDILDDMGLQDDDMVDLFRLLDVDNSGTLDLYELVTGIHKLRGSGTKRDLVALGYMIYSMQERIRMLGEDIADLGNERDRSSDKSNIATL